MASDCVPLQFLSFPNEIIRSVFDYLTPAELVESFGHLHNNRLQHLLASHISSLHLNFTDLSPIPWLHQHLTVIRQHVKQISVGIEFVEPLLKVMPVIEALTIVYEQDTQHLLDHFVARFQTVGNVHIGALTLSTYDGSIRPKSAEFLLGGNDQLPNHTLIISDCLLQINIDRIPLSQLRHVNFIVQEEKVLHALCAHLPNLETITVAFISNELKADLSFLENAQFVGISSEYDDDDESNANRSITHIKYEPEEITEQVVIVAPAHLRSIIINDHIADFHRLSRLFELASSSLRTINMNVWAYSIIAPEQINHVPAHVDFNFNIIYDLIEIPSDFNWQNYVDEFTRYPVIRIKDKSFCRLSSVINKSVFWLETTKMVVTSPQILSFPHVHTILFKYCKITMNTVAVQFIRQAFPHIRTLVWRLSQPNVSTKIPLDMINTLVIYSEDRKTLNSLLALCPNVNRVRFTRAFKRLENLPLPEDTRMQNAWKQIKSVQLVPHEEVNQQEMNKLFPNANVTYDATPFYERMF